MATPGEGFPELLTAREVAQVMRISERSVWRLVSEKKLPAPLHVGGGARWPKSELEAWIQHAAEKRDARALIEPEKE